MAGNDDERWMQEALAEARAAGQAGEVPVGAVVVLDGQVLACAGNRTLRDFDPTAHAEIVALREAARRAANHRLVGAVMYVTLEPCAMCAGALVQARVARLVYGAADPRAGAVRTQFGIADHPALNHRVKITSGVLAEECAELLKAFFAARR